MSAAAERWQWRRYRLRLWWRRHAPHVCAALALAVVALLCVILELLRYIAISA